MSAPPPASPQKVRTMDQLPQAQGAVPAAAGPIAMNARPLDTPVRRYMESRFGRDLSHVRVHAGTIAGARAFTVGNTIGFADGAYAPRTHAGRRLLAHELAHVVQQQGARAGAAIELASDAAEREAEAAAEAVLSGARPALTAFPLAIARSGEERDGRSGTLEARIRRIDELLSYGVFDWAITDAEATEAFQILRAMTNDERIAAFERIDIGRLSENLPQRFQGELAVLLVAGARTARILALIQRLLSRDFFSFDWTISDEDVSNIMQILRTLSPPERDRMLRTLGPDFRRRLWEEAPASARAELDRFWEELNERTFERQRREAEERERPRARAADPVQEKRRRFSEWLSFTRPRDPFTVEVNLRYLNWVERHAGDPEFLTIEPADLYSRMAEEVQQQFAEAREAAARARARGREAAAATQRDRDRFDEFQRFIRERLRFIAETNATEARVQSEILRRFIEWVAANQHTREYRRSTPMQIYERIGRGVITPAVDVERMRAERAPQSDDARRRKFDEFQALAMRLLEYRRRFPYIIPVRSQGVDILVHGDPAQQAVFDTMARELMSWSAEHYGDADYTTQSPATVLSAIVAAHQDDLRAAALQPLVFESIARTGLDADIVASSFASTLGKVLLASAIVGIVIGAEALTLGQVTWIFAGLAAVMGGSSYLERRQEISATGVDVPRAETVLASAGDVIGLSQLIEGMTGLRLGSEQRLNSVQRSEALGEGAGSIAGFFVGTRAFRAGEAQGARLRGAATRRLGAPAAGTTPGAGGIAAAGTRRRLTLPGPDEHFPFGSGSRPLERPEFPNRLYRIMGLAEAAEALRTQRLPARVQGAMGTKFVSLDARYSMLFRERALDDVGDIGRRLSSLERNLANLRARIARAVAEGDTELAAQLRANETALAQRLSDARAANRARAQGMIEGWYWEEGQTIVVEFELAPGAIDHMLNRAVPEPLIGQYANQDVFIWKFERGYGRNIGVPEWQLPNFNRLVVGVRLYAERGSNLFGGRTLPPGGN